MTDETNPGVEPAPAAELPTDAAPATAPEAETPQVPDDAGSEPERKHWAQKRIDELTRNWRDAERREQALLAALQGRQEPPKAEPPKAEPPKLPRLEDFGYDEAQYQAAFLQYATQQARVAVEQQLAERDRQSAIERRRSTFQERAEAFAKVKPDFSDRVLRDPTLPITPAMSEVITDSESGPELAYWLAENREQAAKIAALPPHLAALELGRIEGRLQAQKEAAARPKPVPSVTQAPPPPPVIEETDVVLAAPNPSDPESDKLSDAEWVKLRERQLKRKQAKG